MKNICLFCTSFRFSEIELRKPPFEIMYNLYNNFNCNCSIVYDTELYNLFYQGKQNELPADYLGIKLIKLSSSASVGILNEYYKYIDNNKIDVLIVFHGNENDSKVINYYKKVNKKGIVVNYMDFIPNKHKTFKAKIKEILIGFYFRKMISNTDNFFIETQESFDFLCKNKFLGNKINKKLEYSPFGIADNKFPPPGNTLTKKKQFLYVGRIGTTQKNVEIIFNVLNQLNLKDWSFLFVGPIEDRVKQKINDLEKNNKNISFVGSIMDNKKLLKYYQESSVLVLSSAWESFCLVLVEGAITGNYIVSTNVGCVKDVIKFNNGIIFNNQTELLKILTDIIEEKIDYKSAVDKAVIISDKFYWKNIVKNSKFWNKILEPKNTI